MTFYSTSLAIVGFYVGLNLLLNLFLAYRVSANRLRTKVLTGTGEDEKLYNANRAHVVNVEYTPITLIGLVVLHLLAASIYVLHIVGLALTIGRILHAIGLSRSSGETTPRFFGTLLTWVALLVAGAACIWYAIV